MALSLSLPRLIAERFLMSNKQPNPLLCPPVLRWVEYIVLTVSEGGWQHAETQTPSSHHRHPSSWTAGPRQVQVRHRGLGCDRPRHPGSTVLAKRPPVRSGGLAADGASCGIRHMPRHDEHSHRHCLVNRGCRTGGHCSIRNEEHEQYEDNQEHDCPPGETTKSTIHRVYTL